MMTVYTPSCNLRLKMKAHELEMMTKILIQTIHTPCRLPAGSTKKMLEKMVGNCTVKSYSFRTLIIILADEQIDQLFR